MRIANKSAQMKAREEFEHLSRWHLWFAWKPVHVSDTEVRWLETVHRRGSTGGMMWTWEYDTLD